MKKRLIHYSVIIPGVLFISHQIISELFKIQIQFFDDYLDPFCFSALLLPLISIERNFFFKEEELSLIDTIIITLC